SVRYAGRLASDPLNDLGQGEAVMTAGGGHQTHSSGRWGDYSMLTIDPADNISFWHTNEYYPVTASASWFTRIGKFQFPTASPTPTPTTTPTPGQIRLNARGYKVHGQQAVDLSWTGATSSNVDVYRNGVVVATTPNDGLYTDSPGGRGHASYTYRVCNAGTQTCSNQVTVTF
ncbi:MAG: hypothetical protein ACJ8LV_00790, partial [Chthoniobacterales bacterium]